MNCVCGNVSYAIGFRLKSRSLYTESIRDLIYGYSERAHGRRDGDRSSRAEPQLETDLIDTLVSGQLNDTYCTYST